MVLIDTMHKERIASILDAIQQKKVVVIGDIMLDEYLWGSVERISPEAPVPVVRVEKQTFALGGASNVASNAQALGARPILVGVIGRDAHGRRIRSLLKEREMVDRGIITDKDRTTIVKKRVVAHHQQVVRVDFDETAPIARDMESRVLRFLEEQCRSVSAIILEDYNKGVLTRRVIRGIIGFARKHGVVITADPKFEHFFDFEGVTLFKPNIRELERATGLPLGEKRAMLRILKKIQKDMGIQAMLLTLGEKGMLLLEKGRKPYRLEPHALDVYDVTGAGDTVITAATLALIAGADFVEAARFASVAAAIEVTKLGAAPVLPEELLKFSEQYNS
jgi:rfaE bifunctional protein kinase chain/domain